MKRPSLLDRIMHFDRFDTERYQKYLEARREHIEIEDDEEYQNQGKGCLNAIQLALYFILLGLVIYGIGRL
jgi:hypothetical protein